MAAETKPTEIVVLAQHQGTYGPWYHMSRYVRADTPSGWKFVEKLGGHMNHREAAKLGLPFGRPDVRTEGEE